MNDKEIKELEETAREFERMDLCSEIDEVRTIIQNSANCEEIHYLYKRLRGLENRVDEIDEMDEY